MHDILLVEDDPQISDLINLHFDPEAFNVTNCSAASEAIAMNEKKKFHLFILDISLPDGSGLEICKKLRRDSNHTPILMLTCRSGEADKVLALELGADDYVTKPFGILELMARVKALLRRSEHNVAPDQPDNKLISFRDVTIDGHKMKAEFKGRRLDLTAKEFDLLFLLAGNPGKTFSRHELLEKIWGYTFEGYEHTITSHVNRLRIKIESDLNHPEYILTSWGKGYRFSDE